MTRRTRSADPSSRRRRLVAAATIPVASALLAGCQWTSPVQTDRPYVPADGATVRFDNGVGLNNLLVVTDRSGGQGTLVGMGVNSGREPATITLGIGDDKPVTLQIPPQGATQLSDPDTGSMTTVAQVPSAPGSLVPIQIGLPGEGSRTVQIPVLAPYAPYGAYHSGGPITPTLSPSPTASAAGH